MGEEYYGFHVLDSTLDKKSTKFLGILNETISAEQIKKVNIKFNEAIHLLNKYIDRNIN